MLSLLAMSGECSEGMLSLLLPQESYRKKVLRRLLEDKLITRRQKDEVKGYRLMYRGKKSLLQMSEVEFSFYLADGADFSMRRSAVTQRVRQHRISETLAMMMQAEVLLERNRKPSFFEADKIQVCEIPQAVFYHPREVKVKTDLTGKIISSRMTGIWLTDTEVRLCYNIGETLPTWFENVENRAEALIRSMLREKGMELNEMGVLLFGTGTAQAKECLANPKMRRYILNTPFCNFCYIPLNEKGVILLKLLAEHETFQDLRLILTEDLMQNPEQSRFSCDGYNPDGLPTLLCVDGDLKRLIRFITQLQYQGRQGEVICFDFQNEAIREYCGEKTKISTVDLEAVRRQFLA